MSKKKEAKKAAKLAALEAQRAAEKAERKAAKKAAAKAEKKSGKKKPALVAPATVESVSEATVEKIESEERTSAALAAPEGGLVALAAAEKVLDDPNASEGAKRKAAKIKGDALGGMSDADLKARVKAKQAERKALEASADDVDRDDEEAVRAYNAALIALGGGRLLTSTAERDARAAALEGADVRTEEEVWGAPAEAGTAAGELQAIAEKADKMVAEIVATERGDVIAVGPERPVMADVADDSIAVPSEAPKTLEENGNRQYKIERPSDGRVVGYTRATTYIDNLEDKSAIEKWKTRTVLEGAAMVEVEAERIVLAEVRDLVHRRDVAIAKARKADRKGKLEAGELGKIVWAAESDYKKAMQAIVEDMLNAGGAHEKREKGTDLHALCEVADLEGIAAVEAKVEAGEATESDLADVRAYLAACAKLGLKVVEVETVIVNDELKVAGRLDRIVLYKREGAARATKVVGDVKTGRIDYSAGKIAQQIRLYSTGLRYDLETHERAPLGASKTLGLLIHLPAGMATCTIYEVDLTLGAKGVSLSGDVRSWRNEGKRAFDLKAPLVSVGPEAVAS